MENKMFCFQCQETAKGTGCTISGVCGKRPETSRWQDLLLSVVRGIGTIGDSLNKSNVAFDKVKTGDYLVDALFATITNANFDDTAILAKVDAGIVLKKEFSHFNGPIVFTTNCIVPPSPKANYKDRVFTTNSTGFPGWKHIDEKDGHKDFSEVIALAKQCQAPEELEHGEIVGGFAHSQVFALADKIVEAVKSGAIRKFVVMSGCDGRMKSRDYYREFAEGLPKDVVILTSGCAKYKYNKLQLGDINGIPRVLDAGQCNDSYSWAVVALKLKEIFGAQDINDLPIAFNIAWYEQKAVIVLLALLSLGIKNIHIGPTLPAFVSEGVLKVLVDNFGLGTISTVDEDLKTMIA